MPDEKKLNTHMVDENAEVCLVMVEDDERRLLETHSDADNVITEVSVITIEVLDDDEVGIDDGEVQVLQIAGLIVIQLDEVVDLYGLDRLLYHLDI